MRDFVPLEHGQYYHIYNRGNNGENIFIEERNYSYFHPVRQIHRTHRRYVCLCPAVQSFSPVGTHQRPARS